VSAEIKVGDCREVMAGMEPASVDAIITDPPYGLEFMGKAWDHGVPGGPFWVEALRVAKPGAYLVAFGGTRTYHRLACALEDAGWEIRDCLCWLYGSGFPKSKNIGGGWGTALKPAWEPILLARKPLAGTVAANVQEYGTGAINVDGCRIGTTVETWPASGGGGYMMAHRPEGKGPTERTGEVPAGRWPANVVLDEESARQLDEQSGERGAFAPVRGTEPTKDGFSGSVYGSAKGRGEATFYSDNGGASRFFYTAKASSGERHYAGKNTHPTVKPVDLMRWLCRLVTPPGGLVLDPFTGSGSTGVAALAEGFGFIGIELSKEYAEIARKRVMGPLFA
jgi:site-specific DNA-methyltransferase (adenine-specific)